MTSVIDSNMLTGIMPLELCNMNLTQLTLVGNQFSCYNNPNILFTRYNSQQLSCLMEKCGTNSTLTQTLLTKWALNCSSCVSCIPTCSSNFSITNSSVNLTNSSADVSNYTFNLPVYITDAELSIGSPIATQNVTVTSSSIGITVNVDDTDTLQYGIFQVEGCASIVDSTIVLNLTGSVNQTKTITFNLVISDVNCVQQSGVKIVVAEMPTVSGCSTSATLQNQQILLSVVCNEEIKNGTTQMPAIIGGTIGAIVAVSVVIAVTFYIIRKNRLKEEKELFRAASK